MVTSEDPFNFTVGSQVFIDTEHDGIKYGHVIWHGKPDLYMEEHVGIELVRTDLLCYSISSKIYYCH